MGALPSHAFLSVGVCPVNSVLNEIFNCKSSAELTHSSIALLSSKTYK